MFIFNTAAVYDGKHPTKFWWGGTRSSGCLEKMFGLGINGNAKSRVHL